MSIPFDLYFHILVTLITKDADAEGNADKKFFLLSLACPENTYKSSMSVCTGCPAHSSTNGSMAQMREGCKCIHGYEGQPGGLCEGIKYTE